jgi:transposase-like protein
MSDDPRSTRRDRETAGSRALALDRQPDPPEVKDEFAGFTARDLSRIRLDFLFLDGTNFRFHEHSPAEPVLCAWGIDTDGKPHLVGLAAAVSESADAWRDFLEGLKLRGLARRSSSSPTARRD